MRRLRRSLAQASSLAVFHAHGVLAAGYPQAYPVELNTEVDGVMKTGKEAAREAALARSRAAEAGPQAIYGQTEQLIRLRETNSPAPPAAPLLDIMGYGIGASDVAGGALWAAAFFLGIPSPLLFLGITEGSDVRFAHRMERWLALALGRGDEEWCADRTDGFKATAPAELTAVAALLSLPAGFAIGQLTAFAVGGDHGWSASLGACAVIAAGALEVGRPVRLTREEKEKRDTLWGDFLQFADLRMERRSGGVHMTDVVKSFRQSDIRYIGSAKATDQDIEEAVRYWYREAPSAAGFLRGIVLLSEEDAAARTKLQDGGQYVS